MAMQSLVLSVFILLSSLVNRHLAQNCPAHKVGFTDTKQISARSINVANVYVNVEDPATCGGLVYGWNYCSNSASGPLEVVISMYHTSGNGNYELVNGSYYELKDEQINSSGAFACRKIVLDPTQRFIIQEGDCVAACWNSNENSLQLLGISSNNNLYQRTTGICSGEVTASLSDLSRRRRTALLLFALINVDECAMGLDNCHKEATCSDVVGGNSSYSCICNAGYTGDGVTCSRMIIPSCTPGSCDVNAACVNGSQCICMDGYVGDGQTCTTVIGSGNKQSSDSGAAVAATVTVLLVVICAGAVIGGAIAAWIFYRKKHNNAQKISHHDIEIDNKIYFCKPYDEVQQAPQTDYEVPIESSQALSTDYEIPMESLQNSQNSYLDHGPQLENVYEAMGPKDIYSSLSVMDKGEEKSDQRLSEIYCEITDQVLEESVYECPTHYEAPAKVERDLYAQIRSYQIRNIARQKIEFQERLGSGQFGTVTKGLWESHNGAVEVAVKTLADSINSVKFLQEAAIMAQFKHPNVLALHGVVSMGDPKMIVVELMENGDLKEVLHKMRPDSDQRVEESLPKQLLNFSKQVALGLHYLASRGFVHRDLAARNILVSKRNVCKIADFGMSRDLADDDIYVSHGGMIPVRWTAPEAIKYKQYSTASDVWSYGCVLYEIWSLGHKPFETTNVIKIAKLLKRGYRNPPPPGCPKKMYQLMIDTWHPDPTKRPELNNILKVMVRNVDLNELPIDKEVNKQAAILGVPLEAAANLYHDLQTLYCKE